MAWKASSASCGSPRTPPADAAGPSARAARPGPRRPARPPARRGRVANRSRSCAVGQPAAVPAANSAASCRNGLAGLSLSHGLRLALRFDPVLTTMQEPAIADLILPEDSW